MIKLCNLYNCSELKQQTGWMKILIQLSDSIGAASEKQKFSGYCCTQSRCAFLNTLYWHYTEDEKIMPSNISENSPFPLKIHSVLPKSIKFAGM